jgi:histone H3/H4
MYIPKSTVKRILKMAGAQRVGDGGADVLHTYLNRVAFMTATRAVRLAKHAKRKTIIASDIKLAIKQ